jgi:hypothetical protein
MKNAHLSRFSKAVTPAQAGVQNRLFLLDSGFRRNDEKRRFPAFFEAVRKENKRAGTWTSRKSKNFWER